MFMRVFAFTLAALLCVTAAMAEAIDWNSMDDETIKAEIARAQAVLDSRGASSESAGPGEVVISNYMGINITLTDYEVDESSTLGTVLRIGYTAENTSKNDYSNIFLDGPSINGWEVNGSGSIDIKAGTKKNGNLRLKLADASITTYDEIETVDIAFYYMGREKVERSERITIPFK